MTVVPQKAQTSPQQAATEDRQLTGATHEGHHQIIGKGHVTGHVGHDQVGDRHRAAAADGQTVQAVGQVDRIGRAHHDNAYKEADTEPAQVMDQRLLHEGHHEVTCTFPRLRMQHQHRSHGQGPRALEEELLACTQSGRVAFDHLLVIVPESHHTHVAERRHGQPGQQTVHRNPEQGRHHDREDDHQATHGRRILLVPMQLKQRRRLLLALGLRHVQPFELTDHPRRQHKGQNERRPRPGQGADRDVAEDAQRRKPLL